MSTNSGKERVALADGVPQVIDARGRRGITAFFAAGTVNATPVDDHLGTAIAGAAAVPMTTGTMLEVAARFYSLAAAGGSAVVHAID